ncbi:MAG: serine/threonine-protein kinase [Acidobacteriota bacterium]
MIETGIILQNRYRIEKQIGQGGMGKVYVATDERFRSTVAIKETVFEDKNLRKAFEREARLLNSLKHSALPRVSDHFDEKDGQFLVMEYIAGEDLAEMMEQNGAAFPLEDVLKWANQLGDALEYLHSQNIIHRDIKPQNLKLTPNGQIVLLDFGLAKGNASDAPHQTAAKSIFGYSRNYASLEQIQGTGTEPRSDLYSLSATLYHLLTGVPPADALTRAMNVLNNQPDPLIAANLVNGKIPRGVAEVLQKAMALNAAERPESAVSMQLLLADCDKKIVSGEAKRLVDKSLKDDFLAQDTKIMAAATNAPNVSQSEAETKIVPENTLEEKSYETRIVSENFDSELTNVRQSTGNTKNPKLAKVVGAAVFGFLLLIGIGFFVAYLRSFNVFKTNTESKTNDVDERKDSFAISTQENQNTGSNGENQVADLADENFNAETQAVKNQITPTETAKKSVMETKTQSKNSQTGKTQKADDEIGNIVVDNDKVEIGDMIIDDNGIRTKTPKKPLPPNVKAPPATEEELKYLTPEQIRKLKQLENGKFRVIVKKTPTPTPTP